MAAPIESTGTGQAIIYCRVSTKGQEEHGTSLDSQEREGVAHAATLGFTVGRITREVFSGAELWDRPKLSRDRADLKSGAFAALVCYSTDRLSRDPIHLAILAEECERAGVALHFVSETFDDSDEAALIRYVKGYSNKKEREKIRERFLRGKYQRALNGKIHNMGPEKYGWRRDKAAGVRVVYEPEARVIRRIFTLVACEGQSYYSIGRLLSAEGVPAPGAARFPDRPVLWKADTIMRIIRDPAYKGEGEAWKWKRAGRSSSGRSIRIEQRPAEERVALPEGVVPAIVDADLWQRAQEAVAAQSGNHTRNERLPYLLRGLIYCPVCARKLYPAWHRKTGGAPAGSPKRRVYRCASQAAPNVPCGARIVNAEKIEVWVWAKVLDALDHPEVLAAERERQQQEGPDPLLTDDLEKARREVAKCEREQRKLTRRYAEREEGDGIPWKIIERELKALEAERAQWEATAAKIETRLAEQRAHVANLEALTAYCERMRGRLEEATWEEQRTALEALAVRVDANGQHWHIRGIIPLEGIPDGDIDSGTDGGAVPSDNLTRLATSAGCVICGRSAGASTESRRPISSAALSCAAFAWPSPCSRHSSAKSTASRPPSPPYWRSSRDDSSMTFSCAVPTRRMMASSSAVCSEAAP